MLDFLISNAFADGAPAAAAPQSSPLLTFIPVIAAVVLMYFMVFRPQSKRAKAQRELMGQLAKGNEIVFASGLTGRVTKVADDYVNVEIAAGIELTIQKSAVQAVLPKGSLKDI